MKGRGAGEEVIEDVAVAAAFAFDKPCYGSSGDG